MNEPSDETLSLLEACGNDFDVFDIVILTIEEYRRKNDVEEAQ